MTTAEPKPARVFISYSHDSDEHAAKVLAFADSLRANGLDAVIDQYTPVPSEGWPLWMERQLDDADFTLMVCTETYHRRVMRREAPGKGKGVQWEGSLIYNRLYQNLSQGDRYLPILFNGGDARYIPDPTQGHTYFTVKQFDFDDSQYEALYRHLTKQPSTPQPGLGSVKVLPPRDRHATYAPDAPQGAKPTRSEVTQGVTHSGVIHGSVYQTVNVGSPSERAANAPSSTPAASTPGSAPSMPIDRLEFIKTLNRLTSTDMSSLVHAMQATSQVSENKGVGGQAADLMGWVESVRGPGLPSLIDTYERLFGSF